MGNKNWSGYQKRIYMNNVCPLLKHFLKSYTVDNAVDLGCGAGNETVYMLKKGVKVTAIDRQLNREYILDRINEEQKKNVSFIESDFINVEIPSTQLVAAFFSIPFCEPDYFDTLWKKIYDAIEPNGYFVGQLFGDRDGWKDKVDINTFEIEKAKEYLEIYDVLYFKEIEYVRERDNKKWHFYNIIAQKHGEN